MAYGTLAAIADATKSFATDVISGSIFNRTKVAFGAEGVATDVSSANPLPVVLGAGANAVGSITNTAFGISGTLPAFASTPAVTIGGTLPAFAATPTFNIGTSGSLALDATLATTNDGIGAPADAAYAGSGSASVIATIKGLYNLLAAPLPTGANTIGAISNTAFGMTGAIPAGANSIGTVVLGAGAATVGTVNLASGAVINPNPASSNGGHTTVYTALSPATTAVAQIKASVASVGVLAFRNNSAATRYVKLFFLPSASVTMGTTSPGWNIGLAAGQTREVYPPLSLRSGTGLSWAVTTGQALLDNTAGAAGDVEVNVAYI